MNQVQRGISTAKKAAISASIFIGGALAAPIAALAQGAGSGVGSTVKSNLTTTGTGVGLSTTPLAQTVGLVIKQFLGLIGVVLVVFIIYAGFLWMTAAGNEEAVTKAKDIIKNAIIGMIIMFAAYAITDFVINAILTGTGTT